MTLLITVFAAIISTIVWYFKLHDKKYMLGRLCLMYWGASLMWMVDAIAEYIELKDAFFTPASADMINDAFLGVCVVALGLIIWLGMLMVKDPGKVLRTALVRK